eukprot:TRINITY_DN6185_c0_g3_i2.p1 TRINITY_DN6185_c0_g3~~TRINITY_DN6185_c0_g3_i2.p1  ORF type:complete len:249 (+),score=35.11 TRINITY_DN6185_c0_g3_i2:71-748(+)
MAPKYLLALSILYVAITVRRDADIDEDDMQVRAKQTSNGSAMAIDKSLFFKEGLAQGNDGKCVWDGRQCGGKWNGKPWHGPTRCCSPNQKCVWTSAWWSGCQPKGPPRSGESLPQALMDLSAARQDKAANAVRRDADIDEDDMQVRAKQTSNGSAMAIDKSLFFKEGLAQGNDGKCVWDGRQCGGKWNGKPWHGPTRCCSPNQKCVWTSAWWSGCQPKNAPPPPR